MHETSTATHAA